MNTLLKSLAVLLLLPAAHAAEGMWQPRQLPQLTAQLEAAGLQVTPKSLSDLTGQPMGAIVSLGHCSASFVSPEGLAITNHHCIQRILQHNSTTSTNLIEDGYLADASADELPGGPGQRILVTVDVTDVTAAMLEGLTEELGGLERKLALDSREKKLIAACEKEDGYRCEVRAFFEGLSFYLIRQFEIRDVRLVYAPARGIGNFGGDIDNWMWPRHTGDYSFLRAYVAADGSPADYAEDNVPYRPEHYLTIATSGLADGDFVMAVGYPGRTYRHRLALEAEEISSWYYPLRKRLYEQMLAVIESAGTQWPETAIKYSALQQSLNNVIKNYGGMIEGFSRSELVERKQLAETEFSEWLEKQPESSAALSHLRELVGEFSAERERRMYYRDFLRRRATLLDAAAKIYRLSQENEKPDAEREPGYQERDLPGIRESLQSIESSFDARVDRALLQHHLELYANELPPALRIKALDDWFGITGNSVKEKSITRKLKQMYERTTLDQTATRLALMTATPAKLEASRDPLMQLAIALNKDDLATEQAAKRYEGRFQHARSGYLRSLSAWLDANKKPLYADANGTLRVTYGQITGYQIGGEAAHDAFTTVAGVARKHTGKPPFSAPAPLLAAVGRKHFGGFADLGLGSVPVNFIATLDSTGGNSGSAVLNAQGELVGLLFDGNYEAIISDWHLDTSITRSICVDMRYVLWIMETVDGAHSLLREMGLGPAVLHARQHQPGVN